MDRFYASSENWKGKEVFLPKEEANHAIRVLRKGEGDVIEVFDGEGKSGQGSLFDSNGGTWGVLIKEERKAEPLKPNITLVVAIPKGKTMDFIIQKSVELGVSFIQPLLTENVVVKLDKKEFTRKVNKWQKVALEACKQCGQNRIPKVSQIRSIEDYLKNGSRVGLVGALCIEAQALKMGIESLSKSENISLFIGPEGDFSRDELSNIIEAGYKPVTLGETVLRVDTACLYLISVIRYYFNK